ncbi:hypothetical protein Tco_1324411, partial [Tanacetum coccineum]
PDYSTAFDTESDPSEDPSPDRIPPLPGTSPFLSSTNDSSDSNTPDTQPSPTHGTTFTKITFLPRVQLQHLVHFVTEVGSLPTHRLTVRHSVDYSSSHLFTSDDSLETSSDSSPDDLSDS